MIQYFLIALYVLRRLYTFECDEKMVMYCEIHRLVQDAVVFQSTAIT